MAAAQCRAVPNPKEKRRAWLLGGRHVGPRPMAPCQAAHHLGTTGVLGAALKGVRRLVRSRHAARCADARRTRPGRGGTRTRAAMPAAPPRRNVPREAADTKGVRCRISCHLCPFSTPTPRRRGHNWGQIPYLMPLMAVFDPRFRRRSMTRTRRDATRRDATPRARTPRLSRHQNILRTSYVRCGPQEQANA